MRENDNFLFLIQQKECVFKKMTFSTASLGEIVQSMIHIKEEDSYEH